MRSCLLLVLLAAATEAQVIYSWEDSEGVHYTDDPARVPKDRRSVQKRVMEGGAESSGLTSTKAPLPPSLGSGPAAPAPIAAPQQPNEREWRDRFIAAYRHIDTLKRSIAALEASLPPRIECAPQPRMAVETASTTNSLSAPGQGPATIPHGRCLGNPLHDRIRLQIAQQGVELKDAKLDLEQLERQASQEAIPREWRRGW